MARHSFIRMSKLPNVKGRIDYISSPDRQENLYATYQTADMEFWKNLAFESQQEFRRFGTEGKCIEARELIIALPEVYTTYDPQEVLKEFTEEFHKRYGVECVSALHHNKRKTNYHMVEQPIVFLEELSQYPLAVALASVPPGDPNVQLVCCILAATPPLLLFALFNREMAEGIELGGGKAI